MGGSTLLHFPLESNINCFSVIRITSIVIKSKKIIIMKILIRALFKCVCVFWSEMFKQHLKFILTMVDESSISL